jgi:hypothetical protein
MFSCEVNYPDASIHVSDSHLPQAIDDFHVKGGSTVVQSLRT